MGINCRQWVEQFNWKVQHFCLFSKKKTTEIMKCTIFGIKVENALNWVKMSIISLLIDENPPNFRAISEKSSLIVA